MRAAPRRASDSERIFDLDRELGSLKLGNDRIEGMKVSCDGDNPEGREKGI